MKNAHEFPGLHDDLFDFTKAGYVMIETEMPYLQYPIRLFEYGYESPDPAKFWMKGMLTNWHVTARGPLDPKVRQSHCQQVLQSWDLPEDFILGEVEVFPSPFPEEPYDCIVVAIDDPALFELNQQLAVLPGVQTYIPYKPHLTLGYFKSGHREEIVDTMRENLRTRVSVSGYNFGRMAE